MGTVNIVEVGMRDGLQNESSILPTQDKITFIHRLIAAGVRQIEVGSFVRPDLIPALADTADVMQGIERDPAVRYIALVPNLKGMERAVATKTPTVAVFAAATEDFTKHNINMTIAESLTKARAVLEEAKQHNIAVRGYVSVCWKCPYEGDVALEKVVEVAAALHEMGCYEVSLGDTIGAAQPEEIAPVLRAVMQKVPADHLAVHFHDTHEQALENIKNALKLGITTVDASVGGLGGCPYAPGAAGNVATEAVVAMLTQKGYATGIDVTKLQQIGRDLRALLAPSHV